MMKITLTIHRIGNGICSLTGKDGDGLIVSFEDGTVQEAFLSHKVFLQLVRLKFGSAQKAEPKLLAKAENGVALTSPPN